VNYWKVILATVVIFGAGVLTGGLLVNYVDHSHHGNLHRPQTMVGVSSQTNSPAQPGALDFPMPRLAKEMGRQFVQQLNNTLHLTPEQRVKIEKIIADGQERNHEIWTNTAPKMRAVMQEVDQQIREELTPEQQKPFEELLKHPPRRPPFGTNAPTANQPPLTNAPGI
jgi:Spy/CpxP family protein refolding chaperone